MNRRMGQSSRPSLRRLQVPKFETRAGCHWHGETGGIVGAGELLLAVRIIQQSDMSPMLDSNRVWDVLPGGGAMLGGQMRAGHTQRDSSGEVIVVLATRYDPFLGSCRVKLACRKQK